MEQSRSSETLIKYGTPKDKPAAAGLTLLARVQGIYGWRSAEVGNLAKMTSGELDRLSTACLADRLLADFKGTTQILLEENYRSSSAILKASLAVVEQGECLCSLQLMAIL